MFCGCFNSLVDGFHLRNRLRYASINSQSRMGAKRAYGINCFGNLYLLVLVSLANIRRLTLRRSQIWLLRCPTAQICQLHWSAHTGQPLPLSRLESRLDVSCLWKSKGDGGLLSRRRMRRGRGWMRASHLKRNIPLFLLIYWLFLC
jgi:hypothetical protein